MAGLLDGPKKIEKIGIDYLINNISLWETFLE